MIKHFRKIYIIIFALLCLIPSLSFAADVSIYSDKNVEIGNSFEILINANTDGVPINSIDIVIDYDESLVSFSGYKTESTITPVWIDSPHEKNGNIYMSGIIPGGVSGLYDPRDITQSELGPIPIARLLFTTKNQGNAKFSFIKTEILEHDGEGTKLSHTQTGTTVLIKNNFGGTDNLSREISIEDKEKPEPFSITFLEASASSSTPSMIIFEARDIGSGIKEYKMNKGGSMWINIQSPWEVRKGIFPYNLTVRAYDFAGNFEDSSIYIQGFLSTPIISIASILFILLCFIGYKMIKYKRNEP